MELGDNPCAEGLPVTIGWEADETHVFDLDQYESVKPPPRERMEFHMPSCMRYEMISKDSSRSEIMAAVKETQKVQKFRAQSVKSQKWDDLHYKMEKAKRKLKKVASLPLFFSKSSGNDSLRNYQINGGSEEMSKTTTLSVTNTVGGATSAASDQDDGSGPIS